MVWSSDGLATSDQGQGSPARSEGRRRRPGRILQCWQGGRDQSEPKIWLLRGGKTANWRSIRRGAAL